MPFQKCTVGGKSGVRWGNKGKCYTGPNAKAKAARQMRAIRASGFTGNAAARGSIDPTRTATLRAQCVAAALRRLRALKQAARALIVAEDAFGLVANKQQFAFLTDEGKLLAWRAWLQEQVEHNFVAGGFGEFSWLDPFISEAYKRATRRAIKTTRLPVTVVDQVFQLGGVFRTGASVDASRLLYLRAYEQLQGISAEMSAKLGVIMAEAVAYGADAAATAKRIDEEIDGIGLRRAVKLARTELIYAYTEGTLDTFERLGVRGVQLEVEFTTAGDDRVCPQCNALAGKIFTIDEARGVIPIHPQCRCAWIPAVGEVKQFVEGFLAG